MPAIEGLKARVWHARAITARMVKKNLRKKLEERYRELSSIDTEDPDDYPGNPFAGSRPSMMPPPRGT